MVIHHVGISNSVIAAAVTPICTASMGFEGLPSVSHSNGAGTGNRCPSLTLLSQEMAQYPGYWPFSLQQAKIRRQLSAIHGFT
jgi:hypothetical protein